MKIAFDAKRAFQNRTGLGNYSRFLIEALLKHAPKNQYLAYTPKTKIDFYPENLSVKLPKTTFYKFFKTLWRSGGLIQDLKKDKINIFHGLSNELPSGLKKAGIKSVVTIHDLIFERFPQFYNPIDRFIYHYKFKKACQDADVIVAVSEQTKNDIRDFYKIDENKIQVIYQDCDEIFKQKVEAEDKTQILQKYNIQKSFILCVATIAERKNQLNLVKAFHVLNKPNLNLVLIGGKSKYQQQIEKYIEANELRNQVIILNKVPLADLPAIYQSAEIFAYPSFFEGFGIPILEARHSGIPVFAATGSCLEEAGGGGAIYVSPDDINQMAVSMQKILENKPLRIEMVEAGQKHIQQFAGINIAKKMNELYQSL